MVGGFGGGIISSSNSSSHSNGSGSENNQNKEIEVYNGFSITNPNIL